MEKPKPNYQDNKGEPGNRQGYDEGGVDTNIFRDQSEWRSR